MDKFEASLVACLLTPLGNPNDPLCRWGIVANYIGGSGIGKSERITSVAKIIGLNCYPIFSATKTPEHIGGFPANTPEGFMLKCALPQVLYAIDDSRAVIFLDEISTAPPAVQAALLSFVNERTVGEYVLPVGVRIIMAMNPADMAANGHDLEIPMANRIAHFKYSPPTVPQWQDYVMGQYRPTISSLREGEALVRSKWQDNYPQVAALACNFMDANNGQYGVRKKGEDGKDTVEQHSKLYDQPDSSDPRASGPWPSHRTWYWAVHGIATVRCLGLDATLETEIVAALVGEGLAVEWTTYAKKLDIPKPEDVLTKGWEISKRLDLTRVVLNSCAAYVVNTTDEKYRVELAISCWGLLARAMQDKGYADITIKPTHALIQAGLDITHSDTRLQQASEDMCAYIYDSGMTKYIR